MKFEGSSFPLESDDRSESSGIATETDAALGALLEEGEGQLGSRVARLDALNVSGMLAAATERGGAELAARLEAALSAGAALGVRRARCDALCGAAPDASRARSGAARADGNARALLAELEAVRAWLEPPPLRDLDALQEVALATAEGRAVALAAAEALRETLRAPAAVATPARLRLAAVRERLARLGRARDQLAAALARHLNNALIHLGNEAAAPRPQQPRRHHADLLPYAPFMRWLKDMDEKAFDALLKVYAGAWARVYEREVRAACDAAAGAAPAPLDERSLDAVLELVETLCNAEQDFCAQFFCLEQDAARDEPGTRRVGAESRRLMVELFPTLEQDLVTLVGQLERQEPYGAMRALACVSRRVLGADGDGPAASAGAGAGETRWARAALAGAAVAAKRGADRCVAERLAALPDAVKQAQRRPKCGLFAFAGELERLSAACEGAFAASGRRADLDRWYLALAGGMVQCVRRAEHPRTPRAVLHMENYHRLHGALSELRAPALDPLRRECRARYHDALRSYVTQYFPRPLEKLAQFFEGVAEAVAGGVREDEVCYRAAFSKHELRRVLALYPAAEVRKSLHRLYRTVEKHLSEEGGLLQVVWRAMQEEFIAQHVALQARIASCYGGSGLALPLTTQDILDAFSDIAREH